MRLVFHPTACGVAVFAGFMVVFGRPFSVAEEQIASETILHTRRIALPLAPDVIAVSRDGSAVAVGAGSQLFVFDLADGELLRDWKLGGPTVDVSLPKANNLVAVTTGSTVVDIYDIATGERSHQLHRKDAPGFLRQDGQQRIALWPDGTKLISTGGKRRLYVSDVATGLWDHIMYIKYSSVATPVVSPDGKHVTLISRPDANELSGHVSMFKVRRGLQPLWTKWHDGEAPIAHASFSADSCQLATCGSGDGVRIWDVASGKPVTHLKIEAEVPLLGVSFVAGENELLIASKHGLTLRNMESAEVVASSPPSKESPLKGFAASTDGSVVVTFTNESAIDVWSFKTQGKSK